MTIPFLDLKHQYAAIREEIHEAIQGVFDKCLFASGSAVAAFENKFAQYCGVRHCIAVNSGTSALHLALIVCGVGPGDEVITVPLTFVATAWAISYVGARPVFVDIEPDTYTMDVRKIKSAITSRTRAILAVHLYGQMASTHELVEICQEYGLAFVEDAAQAHGALNRDHRAGGAGNVGCFSFYPSKNLGAYGEGGAVTTNDDSIAARLRALRDHAQRVSYRHEELGFNYRMDEIQAAVLGVKLRHLDSWNAARRQVATRYEEILADTRLTLPREAENRYHVWHLYVIRHLERDSLRQALVEAGIGTGLHYPVPVHLQPAFAYLNHAVGDFPVAEQLARECLSLPIYPELTELQQARIGQIIRKELD